MVLRYQDDLSSDQLMVIRPRARLRYRSQLGTARFLSGAGATARKLIFSPRVETDRPRLGDGLAVRGESPIKVATAGRESSEALGMGLAHG